MHIVQLQPDCPCIRHQRGIHIDVQRNHLCIRELLRQETRQQAVATADIHNHLARQVADLPKQPFSKNTQPFSIQLACQRIRELQRRINHTVRFFNRTAFSFRMYIIQIALRHILELDVQAFLKSSIVRLLRDTMP